MPEEKEIKEQNSENIKEDKEVKPVVSKKKEPELPVYISITDFIKKSRPLSRVEKKYYTGNFEDGEMRTKEEWEIITNLK